MLQNSPQLPPALAKNTKLALPTYSGIQLLDLSEIVRLQAQNNYTLLFLQSGKEVMIPKTLSKVDASLTIEDFIRVHKSHIINLAHAMEYKNGDDQTIIMRDKSEIQISRRRLSSFKQALRDNFIFIK